MHHSSLFFLRAARQAWSLVTGRSSAHVAKVIVHDPAAGGPKNLDDPFHDPQAQQRAGELIARAASAPNSKH
jgi:hypothetical protein